MPGWLWPSSITPLADDIKHKDLHVNLIGTSYFTASNPSREYSAPQIGLTFLLETIVCYNYLGNRKSETYFLGLLGRSVCMYIFKNYYLLEHYFYNVFEAKNISILH